MTMTKTTTETAAAWADAQVRRHTHWPVDILGAGPRCTGNCKQGRALCVHPVECGVQHPVAEAATDIGADSDDAGRAFDGLSPGIWIWCLASAALLALVLALINNP